MAWKILLLKHLAANGVSQGGMLDCLITALSSSVMWLHLHTGLHLWQMFCPIMNVAVSDTSGNLSCSRRFIFHVIGIGQDITGVLCVPPYPILRRILPGRSTGE